MRQKEQRLWDAMRNHKPPTHRLERIENMVGDGIPDVWCICNGVVRPCELKAVYSMPHRASTPVMGRGGLRQEQKNWHMDWAKFGGRSVIILGVGVGAHRQLIALDGRDADWANTGNWAQLCALSIAIGVGATFWPRLFKVLEGEE